MKDANNILSFIEKDGTVSKYNTNPKFDKDYKVNQIKINHFKTKIKPRTASVEL
jgi:hypothetical protein